MRQGPGGRRPPGRRRPDVIGEADNRAGGARRRRHADQQRDPDRRRRDTPPARRRADDARRNGLTVVDLSDDWLPYVFSEEPDKPQPLRPYLVDLANGRFRGASAYARAREDRFFEAFGIFPSLNLVRRRLADKKRHACHERVKDSVLEELSARNVIPAEEAEKVPNPDAAAVASGDAPAMIPTGRTVSPRPLTPVEKRAVIAMQAHLRCEDVLSGKASAGRMDRRTVEGLKVYQRLQMLADNGNIDSETRAALLGDSREQDFRALLRALRARVVDVTGLIEDGSALGAQGTVQGREIDTAEFRPLSAPPGAAKPARRQPPEGDRTRAGAARSRRPFRQKRRRGCGERSCPRPI